MKKGGIKMAIYFIQAFLIVLVGSMCPTRYSDKNKKRFLYFAFGLLILVAALRSPDVGKDLAGHYARNYTEIASYGWSEISGFSVYTGYGIGYCYFMKLLTLISTDVQFYIAVTSIIIYGSIGRFIYNNSTDVKMSTYLFIFSCTYYMLLSMIRQALAIAIILTGYEILKGTDNKIRRYILFTIFVFLASLVHSSAILCLCMILFDALKFTRKQILIGVIATGVFYVAYIQIYSLVIDVISGTSNYGRYLLNNSSESVGNVNLQSIYMVMTILWAFILGCKYIVMKPKKQLKYTNDTQQKNNDFLMYMGLLASICRFMVFRMNIINRVSWYFVPFVLLLYPKAIQNISNIQNRKIIRYGTYLFMLVYFVWMTVKFEEAFHGTVPYIFFWNSK